MKKFSVCLCLIFTFILLSLTITSTASAVVRYTYTGNNFTTVTGLPYTTSMSVNGWLEMANPIPPSTPSTNFLASITAYSFFDGVQTLTNANSVSTGAFFATDASGNITTWTVSFRTPVPGVVNSPAGLITATSGIIERGLLGNCQAVGGPTNTCFIYGPSASGQIVRTPGTWAMQIIPANEIVPTMNEWGMIIFMVLAGIGSIYYMRRKNITE